MNYVLIPAQLVPVPGPQVGNLGSKIEVPTAFDFIQHYYGKSDQTKYWNEYKVRPKLAEIVANRRL